jgi:hypothetical protein
MNKGTFTYCLLQYHHSQLLGEVLNIGLVVYFPHVKKLEILYPEKLLRLKFAYPDVPEKTIKAYYKYFEQRVAELNNKPDIFADYELHKSLKNFVDKELLPSDSSALQFGNYRSSVFYTPDTKHLTNQLYNLYFSVFHIHDSDVNRIDESILLKKYKKLLLEFSQQHDVIKPTNKFHYDYAIAPNNTSKVTFDIAWKDRDSLHLVKPMSFDLKREDSISKKAYQYYGQFLDLEEVAENNNYLFDVILAKPKTKALFATYDNAIRLLQKPKRVKLIELTELNSYSKATAELALN